MTRTRNFPWCSPVVLLVSCSIHSSMVLDNFLHFLFSSQISKSSYALIHLRICLCIILRKKKKKTKALPSALLVTFMFLPVSVRETLAFFLIIRNGRSVLPRQLLYLNSYFFPFSTIEGPRSKSKSVPCGINFHF